MTGNNTATARAGTDQAIRDAARQRGNRNDRARELAAIFGTKRADDGSDEDSAA